MTPRYLLLVLSVVLLFPSPKVGATALPSKLGETQETDIEPVVHKLKTHIIPHRAYYTMSLASVKNGGNISGVSGKLAFEWGDVCDGWAIQQHMKLHFNYAQGDEADVDSSEISWESKDGKKYNFNIHHLSNGKETEYFRGKAALGESKGHVVYTIPKDKTEELPEGTIFPSSHTSLVIQKALSGEKLFTRHVFDGTDDEGSSDISVFISPAHSLNLSELNEKLKNLSVLHSGPAWPVRMAFYKANSETGEPDYEMDMTLLANGIVEKMRIDYGDFAVYGILTDLELLPASGC